MTAANGKTVLDADLLLADAADLRSQGLKLRGSIACTLGQRIDFAGQVGYVGATRGVSLAGQTLYGLLQGVDLLNACDFNLG